LAGRFGVPEANGFAPLGFIGQEVYMRTFLIALFLMLLVSVAGATELRWVLLPVWADWDRPVAGSRGTLWTTELWVRNNADTTLWIQYSQYCFSPHCSYTVPPGTTARIDLHLIFGYVGAMIRFSENLADQVHLSLGLRELSSGEYFAGYLPVVYDEDLFEKPVEFVRVALEPARRTTLRVYDPEGLNGEVLLQVWDGEDRLLVDQILPLWLDNQVVREEDWVLHPQVAQVNDLEQILPEGTEPDFLRLRLTPLTPGLKYWAFLSTTDNVTQDVKVILPD
jgi:hypothetical protein